MSIYDRLDWAFAAKVPSAVNASGKVRVGPDKMARLLLLAVRHANADGEVYLSGRRIFDLLGIGTGDGPLAMRALAGVDLLTDTGREVNQTTVWRVQFPPDIEGEGARSGPSTAEPEGVRSPPLTGARSGARWGVRSGVRSGPNTKGKGKGKKKGEDALTRDPPTESAMNDDPTPVCPRHHDGNPDDEPCRFCQRLRLEQGRRTAEREAITCRRDGCTERRDPTSRDRYCGRHAALLEPPAELTRLSRTVPLALPTSRPRCDHGFPGGATVGDDGRLLCVKCQRAAADPKPEPEEMT